MRKAINAIIIEDNSLLIVKKNLTWILPGGKPEKNETEIDCLSREINEELSGTKIKNLSFYKSFEGKTPHKGDLLIAKTYFAQIDGKLYGVRSEDSISEAKFVKDFLNYNLSDITSKIIYSLKNDNYL